MAVVGLWDLSFEKTVVVVPCGELQKSDDHCNCCIKMTLSELVFCARAQEKLYGQE